MCHDNSELLRVKKDPDKILVWLCAEKRSVTSNNTEHSQRCKYTKDIETSKDKLQSRIDSLSKNHETTRYQENEANVVM